MKQSGFQVKRFLLQVKVAIPFPGLRNTAFSDLAVVLHQIILYRKYFSSRRYPVGARTPLTHRRTFFTISYQRTLNV